MRTRSNRGWRRHFRFELLLVSMFWLVSPAIAQTGDALIDALDLSRAELAKVKAAADGNDIPAAKKAFADYLRSRSNIVWRFDPSNPPKELTPAMRKTADDALEHRFVSVNFPWQFEGGEIDWKFNPTALPTSPVARNHEWTWQFNRHSHWPVLATAYHATGDKRYADELCREILSWTKENPKPEKVQNTSFSRWRTIEAGIRMFSHWPNAFFAMVKFPDAFPDDVLLAMVDSMRQHAEYLDQFPTRGNWKAMESNGLFHVGTLFPEFKQAAVWREHGLARQHEELAIQVYPDGVQFELAPGYHNVSLRNFLETYTLAQMNRIEVPADYRKLLERMFDVNLFAMMPDRTTPNFNDSERQRVQPWLARGLELFPNREDWRWIVTDGKEGKPPAKTSHFFNWAGWAVMRSGWDRDALCLVMEAGPFGFGHQHEDKLSFIIDGYGSRLVAEGGIYTYDASPMRQFVVSGRAHNIITVDGLYQSRRGRDRWTYVRKTPLDLEWQSTDAFDYFQGAYGNEEDETWGPKRVSGFVHTRRVLFVKPDYWVVIDTITPPDDQEHTYESAFHLDAAHATIDQAAKSVTTTDTDGGNIAVIPLDSDALAMRIIQGEKEPEMRGWIAESTYEVRPVPTVHYSKTARGPVHFLYVFAPIAPGRSSLVASVRGVEGEQAAEIEFAGRGKDQVRLTEQGKVEFRRADGVSISAGRMQSE